MNIKLPWKNDIGLRKSSDNVEKAKYHIIGAFKNTFFYLAAASVNMYIREIHASISEISIF